MTTYFMAPDGHGEPTLFLAYGDPRYPVPVLRRADLARNNMSHHWDEIVARVIAGNLSATEQWVLDKAARTGLPSRVELTEEESDAFTAALRGDVTGVAQRPIFPCGHPRNAEITRHTCASGSYTT